MPNAPFPTQALLLAGGLPPPRLEPLLLPAALCRLREEPLRRGAVVSAVLRAPQAPRSAPDAGEPAGRSETIPAVTHLPPPGYRLAGVHLLPASDFEWAAPDRGGPRELAAALPRWAARGGYYVVEISREVPCKQ